MPGRSARPDRRRLLRLAGIGVLGIAVGVGATLGLTRIGAGGGSRPAASVQRLDLPAGAASGRRGMLRRAGVPR